MKPELVTQFQSALAGSYTLDRELGRGGMATVYLAHDRTGAEVALKVLSPDLGSTIGGDRFRREIRVATLLQHPNILSVLDSGVTSAGGVNLLWFTMPYVQGVNVWERLQQTGPLGPDEVVRIGRAVADALAYAHEQGVVHRDIKPDNILLEGERVLVADFGVARAVSDVHEKLTATGMVVGTPTYMSPEQASGEREIDGRSDVFALACVLYELLAGEAPFDGPTPQAALMRRFTGPPRALRPWVNLPEALEATLLKALSRDPKDRHPTAAAFSDALAGRAPDAEPAPEPAPEPKEAKTRARGCLGSLALMLLTFAFLACGDGQPGVTSESQSPVDSSSAPIDTVPSPGPDSVTPPPPDTTTPPPPDSTIPPPPDSTNPPPPDSTILPPDSTNPPPPDSTVPPWADCPFPGGSSGTPQHVGLPFGPTNVPQPKFGSFTGTKILATSSACLLTDLEMARRANARVFISFTGNQQYNRDESGFSLVKWKQRVDRFRNVDLTPYIADGTILGHLLIDEPNNWRWWSGQTVSLADIEEAARYSKEVWPLMNTYIRTFPEFLKGGHFPHLDALWFHYLDRWAPLDQFIAKHFREAEELGLVVITGLNVLNGGSKSSGIPGRRHGRNAMSADEIRSWGGKLLAQPNLCAFLLWEYDEAYLARPDIKAAINDLAAIARSYPSRKCGR